MASSKVMSPSSDPNPKSSEDVWRDILASRRSLKTEPITTDHNTNIMTLEDFLLRAAAADPTPPTVKLEPRRMSSGGGPVGFGSGGGETGRGKRRAADTAADQRHRRMIKNRESAARSRERKQAYQAELESLAVRLEEENEKLVKEKAAHTKERLSQLMERVVPVIEKRKPTQSLRRIRSMQW